MLTEILEKHSSSWLQLGHPAPLENFILKHADVKSTGAVSHAETGTPKECFANAGRIAMQDERYEYVEGYILLPDLQFPIHHAWLWDSENLECVDPTLADPSKYEYLGVRFTHERLVEELMRSRVWGLFDQGRGINLELMEALEQELAQ